ncbi:MAG: hypothetical protein AAFN08_05635 [Cyanobacteria bacterium J06559_3]
MANCLLTTNIGVADALKLYQDLRLDRVTQIVLRARKRAAMTHGIVPARTQQWYAELASEDGTKILDAISETIRQGPMR